MLRIFCTAALVLVGFLALQAPPASATLAGGVSSTVESTLNSVGGILNGPPGSPGAPPAPSPTPDQAEPEQPTEEPVEPPARSTPEPARSVDYAPSYGAATGTGQSEVASVTAQSGRPGARRGASAGEPDSIALLEREPGAAPTGSSPSADGASAPGQRRRDAKAVALGASPRAAAGELQPVTYLVGPAKAAAEPGLTRLNPFNVSASTRWWRWQFSFGLAIAALLTLLGFTVWREFRLALRPGAH